LSYTILETNKGNYTMAKIINTICWIGVIATPFVYHIAVANIPQ
jgi:hypothetical protein